MKEQELDPKAYAAVITSAAEAIFSSLCKQFSNDQGQFHKIMVVNACMEAARRAMVPSDGEELQKFASYCQWGLERWQQHVDHAYRLGTAAIRYGYENIEYNPKKNDWQLKGAPTEIPTPLAANGAASVH